MGLFDKRRKRKEEEERLRQQEELERLRLLKEEEERQQKIKQQKQILTYFFMGICVAFIIWSFIVFIENGNLISFLVSIILFGLSILSVSKIEIVEELWNKLDGKHNQESSKKGLFNKKKKQKISAKYFVVFIFMLYGFLAIMIGYENKDISYNEDGNDTEVLISEVESETNQEEIIESETTNQENRFELEIAFDLTSVPDYSNEPYIIVNDNIPYFNESELTETSFEMYSGLDEKGRCGTTYACIGTDLMPTEERGEIGSIKPTGWQLVKYDFVDGKYLYNRCYLIGYELTAENTNENNLITGTRYLNINGMLPFEIMVADYVKETNNHVLYRVTPIFEGDNLLASGVLMEANSVEDNGEGILFNVYCYNVQPGVVIDYATGESSVDESVEKDTETKESETKEPEIIIPEQNVSVQTETTTNNIDTSNSTSQKVTVPEKEETQGNLVWVPTNGGTKYHSKASCGGTMKDPMQVSIETAIEKGYTPCKRCH